MSLQQFHQTAAANLTECDRFIQKTNPTLKKRGMNIYKKSRHNFYIHFLLDLFLSTVGYSKTTTKLNKTKNKQKRGALLIKQYKYLAEIIKNNESCNRPLAKYNYFQ